MRLVVWSLVFGMLSSIGSVAQTRATLSQQSQACVGCHEATSPGIVGQWRESAHQKVQVGCFECHQAAKGDPDGFAHNGFLIATIVSPKDCSKCHEKEYREFEASHHADAAKILGSLDNTLAEVVEGDMKHDSPASVSGCWQCHGTEVKVRAGGKLDPATWPNTGVGRLNPDGSKGSCSACHLRHNFSRAQARMPENCGRCHLGPDHPQMEIYTESKHGIAFAANRSRFEPLMKEKEWIPGKQFEQGPTCSACHMGATGVAGYSRRRRPDLVDAAPAGLGENRRRRPGGRQESQELAPAPGGDAAGLHFLPCAKLGGQLVPAVRQRSESLQRQVRPSGHHAIPDGAQGWSDQQRYRV